MFTAGHSLVVKESHGTKKSHLAFQMPTLISFLVGEPDKIKCKFNKVNKLFLYNPPISAGIDVCSFVL